MHKSLIALAGAASIGLATVAVPGQANAGCFGCFVGAGILGGLTAGAIIGSAFGPPAYYYPPPPPGYYPPPPGAYYPPPGAYYPPPPPGPGPYDQSPRAAYAQLAPGCHWAKRKVWVEGMGYQWRVVQACPR